MVERFLAKEEVASSNLVFRSSEAKPAMGVARGYILSLRASRYSPTCIVSMEICLRFLADYGKAHDWPEASKITTSHIEEYLVYLQERPRWIGKSGGKPKPLSANSVETHYRRIKTFFSWLLERGYVATNLI